MVFVLRQTGSLQKSEDVQSAVSCKGKAGEVVGNGSSNDRLNLRMELELELEVNMQRIWNKCTIQATVHRFRDSQDFAIPVVALVMLIPWFSGIADLVDVDLLVK